MLVTINLKKIYKKRRQYKMRAEFISRGNLEESRRVVMVNEEIFSYSIISSFLH